VLCHDCHCCLSMDGVNLKSGWLNAGRTANSNITAPPIESIYKNNDFSNGSSEGILSSAGSNGVSRNTSSSKGIIGPRPIMGSMPWPAVNGSRGGQTTNPGSGSSWGNQNRGLSGSQSSTHSTSKISATTTLPIAKTLQPLTKTTAPASGISKSSSTGTRSGSSSLVKAPPVVQPVVHVTEVNEESKHSKKESDGNKQIRKEKLEQRRKFLEELSRQGTGAKSKSEDEAELPRSVEPEVVTSQEDVKKPAEEEITEAVLIDSKVEEVSLSKEEWNAKWKDMYGMFARGSEDSHLIDDADENSDTGEGESLLTEEEMATFRAVYGSRIRRKQPKEFLIRRSKVEDQFDVTAGDDSYSTSDSDVS